jgi:hypothetical protein
MRAIPGKAFSAKLFIAFRKLSLNLMKKLYHQSTFLIKLIFLGLLLYSLPYSLLDWMRYRHRGAQPYAPAIVSITPVENGYNSFLRGISYIL